MKSIKTPVLFHSWRCSHVSFTGQTLELSDSESSTCIIFYIHLFWILSIQLSFLMLSSYFWSDWHAIEDLTAAVSDRLLLYRLGALWPAAWKTRRSFHSWISEWLGFVWWGLHSGGWWAGQSSSRASKAVPGQRGQPQTEPAVERSAVPSVFRHHSRILSSCWQFPALR